MGIKEIWPEPFKEKDNYCLMSKREVSKLFFREQNDSGINPKEPLPLSEESPITLTRFYSLEAIEKARGMARKAIGDLRTAYAVLSAYSGPQLESRSLPEGIEEAIDESYQSALRKIEGKRRKIMKV